MGPNPLVEARPNGEAARPPPACAYHPSIAWVALPSVPPRLERQASRSALSAAPSHQAPMHFSFIAIAAAISVSASAPHAEAARWVEYYRTGGGQPVEWDLNEIDLDSITRVGEHLQYQVRIKYADGKTSKPLLMQVDCIKRTRGQFPDPVMRDTFNGTLGREEVKAVCLSAAKEGK